MEYRYKITSFTGTNNSLYTTHIQSDIAKISNLLHNYLNISKETGTIISCSNIIEPCAKPVKLICFDMDSTLIKIEIIDELAELMGIGEKMRKITAQTMYGKLNFRESFLKRVKLLKGLNISELDNLAKNMPVAQGLHELTSSLKEKNIKTAIITGNFSCFGEFLQQKYGFDYVFTTEAEIEHNLFLSGNIKEEIIDGPCKAHILMELCKKEGITTQQCIAVGDGANDIPMLITAGKGIIYNAASCGNINNIMLL